MLFRAFILFIALFISSAQVRALEPDEVFAKISNSIVVVVALHEDGEISVASGVITEAGRIATSCHVVQDAVRVAVLRESYKSSGVVRLADPERDLCQLAVVDTTGFETPVRELVNAKNLRVGQKVYALGTPQGLDLTLSDGVLSSLRETELGQIIESNAPVSQVSIGGGLFDSEGRLIGITTSVFREEKDIYLAIPADRIRELRSGGADRVTTGKVRLAVQSPRLDQERQRVEEAQRAEKLRFEAGQRHAEQETLTLQREAAQKRRQEVQAFAEEIWHEDHERAQERAREDLWDAKFSMEFERFRSE